MRFLLEKVVSEGGGKNAYIEGYQIGGKTATSQTLPRSAHRYISSFMCFAPASDPQVLCLVIINNPTGVYYGGTIAAPVAKELFLNILPYLGSGSGRSGRGIRTKHKLSPCNLGENPLYLIFKAIA